MTIPKPPIAKLIQDGVTANTDTDKAELSQYFLQVSALVSPSKKILLWCPYPSKLNQPIFDFQPISESLVLHLLQTLPTSKASGCTVLTNRVLQEIAAVIAPSLTYLYNLSVSTDTFPEDWKAATVTPIFKNKGSQLDPTNYRPVSLLPSVGKLLDKIQCCAFTKFLMNHNIPPEHQFGFLPGRSTTHQLIYIINNWYQALDRGEKCAAVFLDFQKAFHRVWHRGLMHKLACCGLQPHALHWIKSSL